MQKNIHPSAVVEPGAKISKDVYIGPFCVIGKDSVLEKNVRLESHVCVDNAVVGSNTHIYPFACIGYAPQDLKYENEKSRVIIGENNVIREHVTIHMGTKSGNMETVIGNNCLLMVASHVAHDCIIGNNVILANNSTLGGHVTVGDFAILGGLTAIHQFVKIGAHSIIGGFSGVTENVIPYGNVTGDRATLRGINMIGMKRRSFSQEEIHSTRNALKKLFLSTQGGLVDVIKEIKEEYSEVKTVVDIIDFIESSSNRSMCRVDKSFIGF